MKRNLLALFLCLSFVLTPFKASHAGIAGAGSAFTTTSAIALAGGIGVFFAGVGGIQAIKRKVSSKAGRTALTFVQVLSVIFTVLLLDEEGRITEFKPVNDELAQVLIKHGHLATQGGITRQDIAQYNFQAQDLTPALAAIEMDLIKSGTSITPEIVARTLADGEYGSFSPKTLKVAGLLSLIALPERELANIKFAK